MKLRLFIALSVFALLSPSIKIDRISTEKYEVISIKEAQLDESILTGKDIVQVNFESEYLIAKRVSVAYKLNVKIAQEVKAQVSKAFLSSPSVQTNFSQDNSLNTNASDQQIWGIFGDSKARGTSPNANETGPEPFINNIIYQYISGTGTSAINTGDVVNASSGSPWMKWGIEYYRETSYKVVFVPRGVGGSNYSDPGDHSSWDATGTLYTNAKNAVNNGCADIGTTIPRGILWICGANDERDGVALTTIQSSINQVFATMVADFPNTPIYIVNLGRTDNGVSARVLSIRQYLEDVCTTYPNQVFMMFREANILDMYDMSSSPAGLHFTQYGNDYLGAKSVQDLKARGLIRNRPIVRTYGSTASAVFSSVYTGSNALNTTEKNYMNDMIEYLNTTGDWAFIDSWGGLLLDSEAKSLKDMKRSTKDAVNHGATWRFKGGFETYGSTSTYIDTNFQPSTDGVNYTLNAGFGSVYLLENKNAASVLACLMCAEGSTSTWRFTIAQGASNGIVSTINSSTSGTLGSGQPKANALYFLRRISSTQFILDEDGVGGTVTSTSTALPNVKISIGARNQNGTINLPYAGRFGSWAFGSNSINTFRFLRKRRELDIDLLLHN